MLMLTTAADPLLLYTMQSEKLPLHVLRTNIPSQRLLVDVLFLVRQQGHYNADW